MQFRSTTFYELQESPNEMWAADASRAVRQYVIDGRALLRFQAARDLLGYSFLDVTPAGQWFVGRVTPHPLGYRNLAGDFFLYAQSVPQTRELGPGAPDSTYSDLAGYPRAVLTVDYRTLTYDVKEAAAVKASSGTLAGYPDEGTALLNAGSVLTATTLAQIAGGAAVPQLTAGRYITRQFRPGGRYLVLRSGMMQYVDGSATGPHVPVPEGTPLRVPHVLASYTWHQVPVAGYPARAALNGLGTINQAAFDGWPAQTMLLTDATPRPYRDAFGNRTLDVEYKFLILPNVSRDGTNTPRGHNWILRTDLGNRRMDYVQVTSDGTANGTPPYRLSPYENLFRPDQS